MMSLHILLAVVLLAAGSLIYRGWRNGVAPMPSSGRAVRAMAKAVEANLPGLVQDADAGTGTTGQTGTRPPVLIEPGSGWGGPALYLARRFPHAKLIGYENSPLPWLVSRLRARISGCRNVEFRYGDFRRAELTAADILICYLHPGGMQDIAQMTTHPDTPAVTSSITAAATGPATPPISTAARPGAGRYGRPDRGESIRTGAGDSLKAAANQDTPIIISNTFALPGRKPQHILQSGDTALSAVYVYRN